MEIVATYRARFVGVGREPASIYVCEFSDGVVKVGFTNNARTRLASLQSQATRAFGSRMVRFMVFDRAGFSVGGGCRALAEKSARSIEKQIIKRLKFLGDPVSPFTEFFRGISFSSAVLAAQSVIGSKQAA